jgi:hypothetical protein
MTGIAINNLMEVHGINIDDLPGELYVKLRLVIDDIKEHTRNKAIEDTLKEFNLFAQLIPSDIAKDIETSILKLKK